MIDVLFGSMLALLDMVFFIFSFSLLAIAVMSAVALFYAIRAFNRERVFDEKGEFDKGI